MSTGSVRSAATMPQVLTWVLLACGLRVVEPFNVLPEGALVFSAHERPSLEDYFGYSVSLATIQGKDWMVVAAPRANSSFEPAQFSRTGTLYQCHPTGGSCEELKLEQGTSDTGDEDPLHINNGSLGGSMDALMGTEGMVVCNPLFKQVEGDVLDMPGICYWLYENKGALKKIKLLNKVVAGEQCYINEEIWKDGHGTPQMGFSVHQLKEEGQHLLIGGPGLYDGRGTVALYLYNIQERQQQEKYGVAIPLMKNDSYFGYSVTSGKFSPDGILYVGGAPRAEDLQGKVIVFTYQNQKSDCLLSSNTPVTTVTIKKELNGEQIGEYFGASLAVADINGDGIDELLVGAPLHSFKTGDEGKVYIYMSSGKNGSQILDVKEEIVPKVKMSGARFGTSIASLGDIDKDGYSDVAIGAPYEDSEKGAIYIYYGSPESPFLKHEKRIRASEINEKLRGFGFSFSRGADVDTNTYNDFAVGAYLSGKAVMFRTSPVIRFHSSVRIRDDKIPMNANSLEIYVCIRPNELLEDARVQVTMNIDPVYNRGYVNEMRKFKYDLNMFARNLKDECQNFVVTLKENTRSFKPFEIELGYNITHSGMKKENFCKTCPVLDIKNLKTHHYLYYQTGCAGQICKTDLTLKGNFTDVQSPFVIGSNNKSSIEMIVEVANLLESSYETNVTITFSSAIKLRQLHQSCYKLKTNVMDLSSLICEVPYMLNQTSEPFIFNIHFDMDSVPWDLNLLQVDISVEGSGEEQKIDDDRLTLSLELQHVANISIKGRSSADHIPFANKINGTEDYEFHDVSFEHSYIIANNGPSPVHGLNLKFRFPYKLKSSGSDIYLFVQPTSTRFLQNTLKSQEETFADEVAVSQRDRYPQYLNLDCSFPEVECLEIYYNTSNTLHKNQGITLTFKITSPLRDLGPRITESGVYIRTTGAIENEYIINQEIMDKKYFTAEAEIKLLGIVVSQANVQEWIIIVAIICGIIILAILCIVLWKLGFFKRNKPPAPEEEESAKPETSEKVDTDPLCDSNA